MIKRKCDECGKFSHDTTLYDDIIICDKCLTKTEEQVKLGVYG